MNRQQLSDKLFLWREAISDRLDSGIPWRAVGGVFAVYALIVLALGWYWSDEPDVHLLAKPASANTTSSSHVVGSATTGSLIAVSEFLLDKPGGFLSNDITPPGLLIDNMPNWEYGVLIQVRDLTRAMREVFSRSQSQSFEDVDLAKAEPRLNFSNNSWIMPSSESYYRDGIEQLRQYQMRLTDPSDPQAQFYARADNLRYWLGVVESRLGDVSQQLSASVGVRRLNTDLANDVAAKQSTDAPQEVEAKTPWSKIDDVFYQARGTTWALIQFLRAVEVDFADVLANKNAQVSLQQIIRELEQTQQPVNSPMILNGSGFGFTANHSLVMASYIARANAALIELRELLSQG